jgi:hypothetical protein
MNVAEAGGKIFMLAFLSVWFTGWTIGGVFAVVAYSGRGLKTSAAAVWFVITCVFSFNCIESGSSHVSVQVWLISWLLVSCFTAYVLIRFKSVRAAHEAFQASLMYWSHRLDAYALRIKYTFSFCTRSPPAEMETVPLTMITVTIYLASGELVLSAAKMLSHDHVLALRELVERELSIRGSGTRSRLVLADAPLKDTDRLYNAGVEDGSNITAVIVEEEPEEEAEVPEPMGQRPTNAARCFLTVWLCGWVMGEALVANIIQRSLLGLDS